MCYTEDIKVQKGTKLFEVQTSLLDGNTAAAYVGYAFSEINFVYPSTPAFYFGECLEQWNSRSAKNLFGNVGMVSKLRAADGALSAVYGALSLNERVAVYAPSQALPLMVPNLFKIASDKLPAVFHIAASKLDENLVASPSFSDLAVINSTGCAILASTTVQECYDFSLVAHLAALRTSSPVVHAFDASRISYELSKINVLPYLGLADAFAKLGKGRESSVADAVREAFDFLESATGARYRIFEYVGDATAESVVVTFGAPTSAVQEAVATLERAGAKVGVLKVRLYRPWSAEAFLKALPSTATKVAVIAQSGEIASSIFSDIASSMKMHPNSVHLLVVLVEWQTPNGKQRKGQCTRYLSTLQPGSKITVSIKP
eukprot:Colp12_sorted_trinity150504_noHs@22044